MQAFEDYSESDGSRTPDEMQHLEVVPAPGIGPSDVDIKYPTDDEAGPPGWRRNTKISTSGRTYYTSNITHIVD